MSPRAQVGLVFCELLRTSERDGVMERNTLSYACFFVYICNWYDRAESESDEDGEEQGQEIPEPQEPTDK